MKLHFSKLMLIFFITKKGKKMKNLLNDLSGYLAITATVAVFYGIVYISLVRS